MKRLFLFGFLFSLTIQSFSSDWMTDIYDIYAKVFNKPIEPKKNQVIEVGFSPDGNAEDLVIKVIHSAHSSIRLAGYSFTSPRITKALVEAKKRNVDVALVVDYKNNMHESKKSAIRSLNTLTYSNIPIRTISVYPIHHDKYIVADGKHIETGSFNYSSASAHKNSENVLVVWNSPALAAKYIAHWQDRWEKGVPFRGE